MTDTIFITGAASGIGRSAAERFAAEGWIVAATDVSAEGLDALARTLGPRHFYRLLDVTNADAVRDAMADFAGRHGGRIGALLNSAGIGTLQHFEETPLARHHATIEVNVKGTLNCLHAAFPYLQAAGGAKVINMSSLSAEYGVPSEAVYSASKFFVRGLTEALNIEWERHGIHVSDVMPNFVKTPMMAGVEGKLVDAVGVHLTVEDVVAAIWRSIHDRRRIHRIVDRPKTRLLRLVARLLPGSTHRAILRTMAGY